MRSKAMWIKVIVLLLFIANLAVLGRAFFTLLQDGGKGGKRTARLLLLRVTLAALLMLVLAYGFYTGQLGLSAPWLTPQG